MKKIGLIVKRAEARALVVAQELRDWLTRQGKEVFLEEGRNFEPATSNGVEPSSIPSDVDLVVVLGGDGTLLYAARTVGMNGVPLLGVNLGGLGFLTEISLENLRPALEKVLVRDYSAEPRMMLSVEVHREGRLVASQTVLNDAVINKGALARILDLTVRIDGSFLTSYRADGLIISTPTGSTAYNLAAGGPIVHPHQNLLILTPICPFTLSNRPLILTPTAVVDVEVDPQASDVRLTADGQVSIALEPGDRITVCRSERSIFIITNPYKNYFEILRTKLGWG